MKIKIEDMNIPLHKNNNGSIDPSLKCTDNTWGLIDIKDFAIAWAASLYAYKA